MGALGISLLVASVGLLWFRREQWLPYLIGLWRETPRIGPPSVRPTLPGSVSTEEKKGLRIHDDKEEKKRSRVVNAPPRIAKPPSLPTSPETTPKATATGRTDNVPTFTLSETESNPQKASFLMAPPPRPSRPPTLASLTPSIPRPNPRSQPRQSGSSTLAPPPSHSAIPTKRSRAVVLTPGHSPLDWARLSSSPHVDLRNLPGGPSAPYLRVTPSMLKKMTGRKGKDAWTAMGGKVYNITPYLPFHPGGAAELLRGAGRDSTEIFGEVHPWVNYENMLASCLVGILVSELEETGSNMDEMD